MRAITLGEARWTQRHLRAMCRRIGFPHLASYVMVDWPWRVCADPRVVGLAIPGLMHFYIGKAQDPVRRIGGPRTVGAENGLRIRIARRWWIAADRQRRRWVLAHELAHLITYLQFGNAAAHGARYRRILRQLCPDCRLRV